MKRILAWVLLFVMVLGMFAGCKKEEAPAPTTAPSVPEDVITANDAMEYLKALYPKTEEPTKTPRDYERMGIVRIGGIPFTVVWTTDLPEDQIKAIVGEDGSVIMDVNEQCEVDTPYVLTATITDEYGNTASTTWDCILPAAIDMVALVKEAYALKNGESLPYECTLVGKITNIDTAWNPEYQNITVTIAVEGAEDMPIQCYRLKGDGADKLQVGNIITVTGTLKNYNGTIEFDAGCILDAVEQGDAVEALTDVGEILKAAYKLKDGKSLGYSVELTGVVTEIDKPYDPAYKNISVVIEMEGYSKYPILCYRLKGAEAENIAVNDTITVTGLIKNYKGTIEFDAGCQLIKRVSGGGVAQKPSSDAAKILKDAKKLKPGQKLAYIATLTGEVVSVDNPYDSGYKNVTVTIEVNGTKIQCYRMKGDDASKVAVTDKITVTGQIENYNGKLEFGSGCTLDNWVKGSRKVTVNYGPLSENVAYKMEMKLPPLGKNVYFKGEISSKNYLQTGTYEQGVEMFMEKHSGKGVRFYFLDGETKTYIEIFINSEGKARPKLTTSPSVYWNYDKDTGVYTVSINWVKYYLGTYTNNGETYETASASSVYYLTSSSKGKTQFYFEFVTKASDAPEAPPEPDTPTISGLPTTEDALKTGDKVVIFAPAYSKALSASKVNAGSYYNKGVDLTVKDNKLSGYGKTEIWTVTANADGTYSFANGGKNIGLAAEFSSMNLGVTHDDWQLISLGNGLYNIKNTGRGNYIEWYADKDNWSTYNSSSAATNKLFQLSIYIIDKGIIAEPSVMPEPETPTPGDKTTVVFVDTPAAQTPYKFVMNHTGLGKKLGFTGTMSGFYYGTSENIAQMVDVYLEEVTGGHRIYFLNGANKTYLNIIPRDTDATKTNVVLQTLAENAAPSVYVLNTEFKYVKTTVNEVEWYLGTYGTYSTISASKTSHISDTSTIGVSQFAAWFAVEGEEEDTPVPDEPTVPTTDVKYVDTPVVGTAYKFVLNQAGLGKHLGFTGAMSGYYYGTSENAKEMVDVYLEEVTGGYRIYFLKGDVKTYLNIIPRDTDATKTNVVLQTLAENAAPSVYTLNTAFKYVYTTVNEVDWYLGTHGTYATISASKTYFIEDTSTIGESQFTTWFATVSGSETPENPDTPDTPVEPETPAAPTLVDAPVAGTAYKFGMVQQNVDNKLFFINGAMNGYYMDTTEDTSVAADVYLEETTGGYYLYTMVEGAKKYINMVVSGTYVNGAFEDAAATVYTYDAESKTVVATVNDTLYWIGTRNDKTYTTVGPVKTEYNGFYCQFYTVGESETPDTPVEPETPAAPTLVDAPVAGTAYKFGMVQQNVDNKLFFINGAMNGYYMDTTEDTSAAADVYLEETTGGYYLYTMVEGAKKYINMVVSGTYVNGAFEDAAATVYTYDAESKTVVATVNDTLYWIGTRNDKTYTTVGPVKTEYNGFYCQFYTVGESETPDTPVEPETPAAPTLVDAPVAGTAYKFGMVQQNVDNKLFFINGAMNGYYMDTTEDTSVAADVYLEETTDGYYLYTMVEGAKKYINMVVSGTYVNGAFEDAAATVYTYDAESKTVVATVNDTLYWIGTRNDKTYTTVGPVKTEYNGFYCQFYTVGGSTETPDTPVVPETPDYVTAPEAGKAYKLGFKQIAKAGNVYYFTGVMSGYYGASDTDVSKAVDMYLEAVTGGYHLYFNDGTAKKYINIVASGTHINFTFAETATSVFTFDEEVDALCTTVNDAVYYMGTNGTYVTFGTIAQSNIANETYYPARLYAVEASNPGTEPEPETPPVTDGETLSIADAYAMGKGMEHDTYTDAKYKVTGIVQSVDNAEFGNLTLTDGNGNYLTIYGSYDATGEVSYKDMTAKPDEGDTVTIYGAVGQYSKNPQIKNGWILSFTPGELPEEEKPEGTAYTISFADKANLTEYDVTKQVWTQNGITVTNTKGTYNNDVKDYANPARFYKGTVLTIACSGMKTIVVTCNNTTYAGELKNSLSGITGAEVVVDGKVVTIKLAAATNELVISAMAAQVRVDEITVYC